VDVDSLRNINTNTTAHATLAHVKQQAKTHYKPTTRLSPVASCMSMESEHLQMILWRIHRKKMDIDNHHL